MEEELMLPGDGSQSPIEGSEPPQSAAPADMDGEELPGSASIVHDGEVAVAVAAAGAEPDHEDVVGGEDAGTVAVAEAAEPLPIAAGGEGGKRKRGRPRKNQGQGQGQVQVRAPAKGKEEEEVCFICFDGGELVVCDRRGCPKVYHPPCVNRDASYFRSRGRWNCGWHICSECGKAAHFMCYTCTYSLCKACGKEGRYVSIRGNKGLCEACFATVMLIESNEHSEVGVNFNDKSSWDYLFKEYWLALKGKLSLTLEELTAAKNARKRPGVVSHNEDSSDESYDANDDQEGSSDSFSEHHEGRNSSRKKVKRRSRNAAGSRIAADVENSVKQVDNEGVPTAEDTKWASQELLEFVAHMKDGDTSLLSQFDVQALLLEYIKKNNLRDPRKKSQIICDLMLQKLFVKERVGHFEMLKLLESHFLIKEASQVVTDDNQGGVVDPYSGHMDDEAYSDAATKISSEKRRKTRRRVEEREPQTNLDGYAAIDIHNINLISLRRSLMEDLLDDIDEFSEKVVGSFVRIKIPATGQKQDLYRLVQVVGTSEAAERYKIGKKTTNIKLEILNLDKTETITIDTISNQEFTVEECSRLRQSIKCGLINRLTVRQVQEKAMALQAVRVNDWLESEKLRLGHLRDRASEKGRRKELRECVEKLQLLNTPEERRRRLNEVPEIHDDPKMDPVYESADEEESYDKNEGNYSRSKESFSFRKGREGLSSVKGGSIPSNNWNSAHKSSNTSWETNKSTVAEGPRDKVDSFNSFGDRTTELSPIQGNDVHHSSLGAANRTGNQHAVIPEQSYGAALESSSASLSTGISVPSTINEAEKMWHYRDPSGKVQGPFSMTQLRKWNTTGYFPPDLRIWQNYEKQDEYIFLTDALTGKFQKQWAPQHDRFHQPTPFVIAVDNRENKLEGDWGGNNNPTWVNNNPNIGNWNAGRNDATFSASGNSELPNADRWTNQLSAWSAGPNDPTLSSTVNTELANADSWVNQSSAWSAPRTEVPNSMEVKNGSRGWETSRDVGAWSGQPQALSSRRPTATFSGNNYQPRPYQGRGSRGGNAGRWNQGQDSGSSWNSNRPRGSQPSGQSYERQQSSFGFSGQQSSEELRITQHANVPGNQWRNDPINPATPTQPVRGIWANGQGGVNLPSAPSTASQHMGSGWGINTSNWSIVTHQSPSGTMEPNKAAAAVSSVGGWGLNSSASNVLKQTDKPDGWDSQGDTPMPDKDKMADGWGSNSASTSLKQADKADGRDSWSPVSTSLPDKAKVAETVDATQILERADALGGHQTIGQQKMPFECDALVHFENQSSLPMDGMNPSDSALVNICSITNELSGAVNTNRLLEGDCPSPTPLCERLELPVVQCDELDTVSAAPALGKSEPPAHLFPEVVDNLQPVTSVLTEVVVDKGLIINSEAQNSLSPLSVMEAKLNSLSASVMPTADSDSAHRSEALSGSKLVSESQGWGSVSDQKGDRDGSRPNPPSGRLEQNQTQRPPDTNGSQWSLPSPTPSTESSRWEICADSSSGNDQTNPWVSFDSSKPQPSLAKAGLSMEPAEPSNRGWGSRAKDIQNNGWDPRNHLLAQQNPNRGTGTGPGDTNMGWDSPAQTGTNSNTGWGTTAEGSTDANTDQGISAQRSIIANTGWGATAQGNMNANRGWEAPALGSKNAGTGWGALVPGSTDANTGRGAPSHGSMNPVTGWGAPTHGNAGNPSWGVPAQGNLNPNPGWGSTNQKPNWGGPTQQGNTNANGIWGTVPGNPNSWGAQQNQNQNENEDRYDRGGYGLRNSKMQSGGEGWSSRRGEGQRGICKFHESGYCKKGSNCNYLHT